MLSKQDYARLKNCSYMKKLIYILSIIFIFSAVAEGHSLPEKYYQDQWCGKWRGKQEYRLKDNTRVDCLTKNYAVEFDFAPKWAESFGQAAYYAKMTGKKPAIILIIEKSSDWKYYHRLNKIAHDHNITVWYMKSPGYNSNNISKKKDDDIDVVYTVLKNVAKKLLQY